MAITLSQCSKADLLWIVKRLQLRCKYDVEIALNDLSYEKEKNRISEAEKCYKLADKKRREYLALLEPYIGKPMKDTPFRCWSKQISCCEKLRQRIRSGQS